MGSDYRSVPRNRGTIMSPIPSEKRKSGPAPVYSFTWLDIGVVLVSMGTYLADIVTDILVTLVYWKLDEKIWAGLTLTFLIVPSIIMQVFSTRWYVADGHRATFSMFLIHIFLMGPIKRYITVLKFGLRARKTKRIEDYQSMYSELSDVSMLRLFESFLESAPQLVLQLYIMIKVTEEDHILTGIAAFFSLISLAWAIAAYTKALRTAAFSQDSRKKRVSWSGLALQTLWRVGMVAGRIVALVLFATAYPVWLLVGVGVHWFTMTIWLVAQDTDFCGSWWEERLFNAVIGVIHIFCFFNMKEGRSRWRMTAFYLITLAENSAMILLWFPHRTVGMWYNIPSLITVWGGFIVGLISMLLYYRYFHPSSAKKCHCCMLYYHLVYRCCPCHDVTTFHGTPYRRNIPGAGKSFSESDTASSFGEYLPVSGIYEQQSPEHTEAENRKSPKKLLLKDSDNFDLQKKYKNGQKTEIGRKWTQESKNNEFQDFEFIEQSQNEQNPLFLPKPRATSTPGDELEEKFVKKYQNLHNLTRKKGVLYEDKEVSFVSLSRSSDDDSLNEGPSKINNKSSRNYDVCTSTPSVLKNLPGAQNGPSTDKGNSTLVREWVKKTQDMYGQKTPEDKKGVSFDEAGIVNDFGTLGTRHATKDERDFMEIHFGDFTAGPSGRRDILRLKSFNKKDRQPPKKRVKKRRRSSYNVTDLRNTFREAFGFHAVDQSRPQVSESDDDNERLKRGKKVVNAQPKRKRKVSGVWGETEIDNHISKDKTEKCALAANLHENATANHTFDPKKVNLILARVDRPPDVEGLLPYKYKPYNSNKVTGVVKRNPTTEKHVDRPVALDLGLQVPIDQMKIDMENLHGTPVIPLPPVSADFENELGPFSKSVDDEPDVEQGLAHPLYNKVKHYIDDSNTPSRSNVEKLGNLPTYDDNAGKEKLLENDITKRACNPPFETYDITTVGHKKSAAECENENVGSFESKLEWRKPSIDLNSSNESHKSKKSVSCKTNEKSVYDNVTASTLTVPDFKQEFKTQSDSNEQNTAQRADCPISDKNVDATKCAISEQSTDIFGPVIQIQGGKIMVKHKVDSQKVQLNSNPEFHGQTISSGENRQGCISNYNEEKNDRKVRGKLAANMDYQSQATAKIHEVTKPACNGTMRRDRVEYLYKIGRKGLKKAIEDSPARKRLSFKKDEKWASDDDDENFICEKNESKDQKNIVKNTTNKDDFHKTNRKKDLKSQKTKKSADRPMEHSIEALGKSMEGVLYGGDNYIIHLHDADKNKLSRSQKKSSRSLGAKDKTSKDNLHTRKRKTLSAIENY